ncbi:MAG: T9SS type A sorting domain-containing protein, partial [Candidatus Poribacteria bacterium]
YVQAVDKVGNVSVSSPISEKITCDPNAPEVSIHSPRSNSTIRGEIPITISVYDENILSTWLEYGASSFPSSWELLAGPFYKTLDREQVLLWDTSELDGRYTIRLIAIDKAGNESKIETIFNIDSKPPLLISSGEIKQITPSETSWIYTTPSFSPYNDKIIISSNEEGTFDLWVMSLDSLNRSRLTRSTDIERCPNWSPNGDMIIFESIPAISELKTEPPKWKLWLISSDGKNLRQITFGDGSDNNPRWSPDGSSVAFDSDIDGDREIFLITNMNKVISGAQPVIIKLTNNRCDDTNPEWFPDGSKIIFQSNSKGTYDIMEMNTDGTNVQPLISTLADEIEPNFSPDGKWILYSIKNDDKYEIKAVSYPDQLKQVSLSMPGVDARNGQWSPRMDMVVYESQGAIFVANIVYPLSNLEAFIASPKGGEILSGKVDINGIAKGKNFSHYSLFYLLPNSNVFQQIGGDSTSQVTDIGFLGKWNTEEIEGKCLLKLVAYGKNNEQVTDSVWVMVSNRLPFISIDEPKNGTITGESIIIVKGRAEPKAIVTINDVPAKLNDKGEFSQKIQLSEGSNKVIAKAFIKTDKTKEWTVERTVILDTKPPKLNIESPIDFQVVKLPYVTVKGSVDEKAEVNVLSTRVWISDNGSFERKIEINEGVNIISINAFDSLGRYTSVERRVIYQKEISITSDIFAPAITNVYPEKRAVVTGKSLKISAKIVDNIGLDPFSIKFWLDADEIEDYELDIGLIDKNQVIGIDQYPKILISYSPKLPISEGKHSFKIQAKDTSGNLVEDTFNFTVDTVSSQAIVSAFLLDSLNRIRIVVVPNKELSSISSVSVIPYEDVKYSISSITQKGNYYEAFFDITPSQKNIVMDFNAKTYLGNDVYAQGYLAWNIARSGEIMRLGSEDNAQFISEPINIRTGKLLMTLRSQDGLSADTLALYESDADYRRLKLSGLIYALSASQEFKGGEIRGILGLPTRTNLTKMIKNLVMFRWDDNQKHWEPLDKLGISNSILSSKINGLGTYALFADADPPIIKDIFPKDANEVPLDRFFVSANILDIGSGISEIKLMVDDKTVKYEYDIKTGLLLYFPSELEWGFHKMDITAIDRAGNVTVYSSSFITKDIFKFISVKAYPNPATNKINIDFKLTKSAEVTLKIYTLSGNLIYDDRKSKIAQGILEWKCVNNSGNKVASGIYIYVISAKIFQTEIRKQGKIAIYR